MASNNHLPTEYRECVGIVLINHEKKVFVGQRVDKISDAWQMPQGGIENGEEPLKAALRELEEEVGTNNVEVIAQTSDWLYYDLPEDLVPKLWGGKFRGQKQKWFLMRLNGDDDQINIKTAIPEFLKWKWIEPNLLPEVIIEFKRDLYIELVKYFTPFIKEL